jgi:hypothetical protein
MLPSDFFTLRCTEAYAPTATWVAPLNGLATTGNIACTTLYTVFIREVHLVAEQFKETGGADVDTGGGITTGTLLTVETNMGRFIDFEAN